MKRIKVRDYKDRNVFGVPLQVIVQRTGQPLPQGIQQAMRYLRNQCLDQVCYFHRCTLVDRYVQIVFLFIKIMLIKFPITIIYSISVYELS